MTGVSRRGTSTCGTLQWPRRPVGTCPQSSECPGSHWTRRRPGKGPLPPRLCRQAALAAAVEGPGLVGGVLRNSVCCSVGVSFIKINAF